MTDEEEDYEYYRKMFSNSCWWSVGLVFFFGFLAWIL